MSYQTIQYEKDGPVATIALNRPEVLNAINRKMMAELQHSFSEVHADKDVRVLIIKGLGRSFCAGFDLKEEAVDVVNGPAEWFPRFADDWDIFMKLWKMDKPVIGSVHGYCLGGAVELMLMCDIVIAAEDALFGLPEIRHASGPGIGLLLYTIGSLRKVKELMLLGDSINANEALGWGLINEVVAIDKLDAVINDTARRIALVPASATRITKLYINQLVDLMGFQQSLPYGIALSTLLTSSEEYVQLEKMREKLGGDELKDFFKKRDAEFKRKVF